MADTPNTVAKKTITIYRPREEVYAFWRDFQRLPEFMRFLHRVECLDDRRSRWTAEGPRGEVTWEAEMTEDVPNERIAWRSLPGADVPNEGVVEFTDAPGNRGTEVRVRIGYSVPFGTLGAIFARMTGTNPEQEIAEDMRRFKAILEVGEYAVIEGQPSERWRGRTQPGDLSKKVGLR